jgi:predicted nucleic acid-binding protein
MITTYIGHRKKMSEKAFIDTAAWIALINRDDALHEQAKAVMDQLREAKFGLVTTEFILLEVANALSRVPFRKRAVAYINGLRRLKTVQIVPASTEFLQIGWLLYSDRIDKEWSLTDCISFEIMWRENITRAFTSDHHFEQAGFIKLMRV